MKRFFLLPLLTCWIFSQAFAQVEVNRNHVLVEVFTGTWCVFCPGSALAAEDMIANGHDVSIIKWHVGDGYETPEANARSVYYSVSGYPTQVFDGTNSFSGGSANTSIYPSYLNAYNGAVGVTTPISLTMEAEYNNGTLDITAVVEQVASLPMGAAPVVYVALTESHIPDNWFGMDEVSFVERAMYPNSMGLPLTLNGVGTVDTFTYSITPQGNWVTENLEVSLFIQDPASKVVFNSDAQRFIQRDPSLIGFTDAFLQRIEALCEETVLEPQLIIKNEGGATLTSLDLLYSINGGTDLTMNWTGSMGYNTIDTIALPALTFTPDLVNANTLQVVLNNPNGQIDQDFSDNAANTEWNYASFEADSFTLEIRPDAFGSELTWEVLDPMGVQLAAGGPYNNFDTTRIVEHLNLIEGDGCYEVRILDAQDNGMTKIYPGFYRLTNSMGEIVMESTDGDYGALGGGFFSVDARPTTGLVQLDANQIQLFPNPTSGQFQASFREFAGQQVNVEVFQMNGARILQATTQEGEFQFDLSQQPNGVYLINVQTETGFLVKKIQKQ